MHFSNLHSVQYLFLDEADRLLEEGFLEQVDEVMAACKHPRLYQAVFSATINSGVESLCKSFMADTVRVVIGSK